MLLCLGDSLTFGSVGYSYLRYLRREFKVVNKGLNGDTIRCAFLRLQRYLENPRYRAADVCVVMIGTNDILLPYLKTLTPLWHLLMKARCVFKKCVLEDEDYPAEYEKYFKLLAEKGMKVIAVGIPYIELTNFPLESVYRRNEDIRAQALRYGAEFIDICAIQRPLIPPNHPSHSWKFRELERVLDAVFMLLVPFGKDLFSRARRLALTVDGVHFNARSAKLLAAEVRKHVLAIRGEDA